MFIFTNSGHRYTSDEDVGQKLAKSIVTQEPSTPSLYVPGKTRPGYDVPGDNTGLPICRGPILCSEAFIGHGLVEVPFIFINHNFHIITQNTLVLTNSDFRDPNYIFWRNSLDPDDTFMQLFFGPVFSALSVGTFFLTSRLFGYHLKTSVILAFFFATATLVWAYSKTSFNLVPESFFLLLGVYLFIRYLKRNSLKSLVFSAISIGFALLVREDAVLIGSIVSVFLIASVLRQRNRVKRLALFFVPAIFFIFLDRLIDYIRFMPGTNEPGYVGGSWIPTHFLWLLIYGVPGILLSPGVGIFVFYPILATCFLSFTDFYGKHKLECIMFLSFAATYLLFYGSMSNWHGMNAWAARYVMAIIPFLLLPLGATIEKRKNKILGVLLVGLCGLGVLSNVVYVIQDENWFVYGMWGYKTGLIALGGGGLDWHPAVMYTFEYSQLTWSIITALTNLQPDIYLLFVFGPVLYSGLFAAIIPLAYILTRLIRLEQICLTKELPKGF